MPDRSIQQLGDPSACPASPQKALALSILEQHPAAGLADALQDLARVLEVPDVEDGQVQLDVACHGQALQRSRFTG